MSIITYNKKAKKMKSLYTLFLILISFGSNLLGQINFEDYFQNKQMRFDYNIAGDASTQTIYFEQIREEPFYGGSKTNLIDKFNLGDYRFLIYDINSNKLIYSRGYSDLFLEWQDTPEALEIKRSFYSSVVFPYPTDKIRLEIDKRNKNMTWKNIYSLDIDPKSYFINTDSPPDFKTHKLHYSGNPSKKVDIVIIPDGYTKKQLKKFKKDSQKLISYFLNSSPFSENKDKFNFWLVNAISEDNGTDIPGKNIWNNTVLNTHFYTFDSERYLTTRDVKSIRDLAGCVPYDQIYILVNSEKYGGGGIFNFYSLCSSNHSLSNSVFVHEFGHAFAALADEYAYSNDPAESRYDLSVEPYQPNITTLADFDSKWKDMVSEDTKIPTPDTPANINVIGAFEGAGYVKTKVYRPTHDCRMKSNNTDKFCPVCEKAIFEMIKFYTE